MYTKNPFTIKFVDNYSKTLKGTSRYQLQIREDELIKDLRFNDGLITDFTKSLIEYSKSQFAIERIPAKRILKKYELK